jgi:hypothetical protein
VNRLQPQSVQVDSGGSYEAGRSCVLCDSYCNQGKLGGVDWYGYKLANLCKGFSSKRSCDKLDL